MTTKADHLQGVLTINASNAEADLTGFTANANARNRITGLVLSNAHSAAVVVSLLNGASGAVLFRASILPGVTVGVTFPAPLRPSTNTKVVAQLGASVANDFHIVAVGFKESVSN